jgi:hypothetical protein
MTVIITIASHFTCKLNEIIEAYFIIGEYVPTINDDTAFGEKGA